MKRGYKHHARRVRRQASFELDYLILKNGGKCHWCECPIVRVKNLPKADIISRGAHQVTYRSESGEVLTKRIATIDHVMNIRDGGGNRANIVAACAKCNQLRNHACQTRTRFVPAGPIQQGRASS